MVDCCLVFGLRVGDAVLSGAVRSDPPPALLADDLIALLLLLWLLSIEGPLAIFVLFEMVGC